MKTFTSFLIISFVLCQQVLPAQKSKLLVDKPGNYLPLKQSVAPESNCGFSKTETAAFFQKLKGITEAIGQNPVMNPPKGFDCKTEVSYWTCSGKEIYGIPAEISFFFRSWSLENGKEIQWINEPPEWMIHVNLLKAFIGSGYKVTTSEPNAAKSGFSMEKWDNSADRLNELFFAPGEKEHLASGVDRYKGEIVIIYQPDRPEYWKQVTIREVFDLLLTYWRLNPNREASEAITKMLEDEYSHFSVSEREGFAYYGDSGTISKVGTDATQLPVLCVNREYWDKKLPRSAVQLLSFYCPADKDFVTNEKVERLRNNDGAYHLSRFLEEFDFRKLVPLIDK
jgi:hypothetical protein